MGEGTVNTEGLWRREQTDWSMGSGQYALDRKGDSQETRFLSSKGVDVFSHPMQATLLPDTYRLDDLGGGVTSALLVSRCGDYIVVADGGAIRWYNSAWSGTSCTWGFTYGGTEPTVVNSITTNDSYVYVATDTGLWFCEIGVSNVLERYAANDVTTGFTGGYDMVRWANDQLIASRKSRLYAFQPRSAPPASPGFGVIPSVGDYNGAIDNIYNNDPTTLLATVITALPHNLSNGQSVTIENTSAWAQFTTATKTGTTYLCNCIDASSSPIASGFAVGDTVTVTIAFGNGGTRVEKNTLVTAVGTYSFSFKETQMGAPIYATGVVSGYAQGEANGAFNAAFTVNTTPTANTFTIVTLASFGLQAVGGSIVTSLPPDTLYTHPNINYVWSDATGGETQVYFGGYIQSPSGAKYSGCVYRSDLLGSSTTSTTNTTLISNAAVAQPWNLNTPIQALPMSPDEYPTCVVSYLNFIFIGTNRGIRMCETLSVYDPTATATGDLKSGPLEPNILQPVTLPVEAIVGDGRFIWFSWSNYDGSSTGIGKMDLQTFIAGDPLAPAYVSDLMVTGQGAVNSLDWNPFTQTVIMGVAGLGVFGPYATNEGGNIAVSQYVESGTITSSMFDYGIADKKIPVYFDASIDPNSEISYLISATLEVDGQTPYSITSGTYVEGWGYPVTQTRGKQFTLTVTLLATDGATTDEISPILNRWVLKSWPAVVAGTTIMAIIQAMDNNMADGEEYYFDPYDNFAWIENLRQIADIITYTEGPLSVQCVVDAIDWLPHKLRDTWDGGYEGDMVVSLKTLMPYIYTPVVTTLT
jgi:hypothetical protein